MRPLPLPTRLLGSLGLAAACLAASPANAQEFEAGGPLHGVVLPLMPAQHGAPPGYPGVIPDLQVRDAKSNLLFTAEGLPPERQLYDGSVEHFRAYWFKYLPVKSFFDRQSLIRKWQAADLAPRQAEEYAEPIWWVPRHATERFTGRFNAPVPVVRARVENPVFTLDCGTLNPGLYAIRVVGAVSSNDIVRHRKPLVVRLTVNDGLQGEESVYRQRCKYVEEFYALAELYFHAPERRAYQATLTVEQGSQVDALIHTIDLHDALAGAERRAVKTRPTLTAPLANPPLATNDSARLARDAELWNAFVPINAQIGMTFGGGGDDAMVNRPNFGAGGLTPDEIRTRHGDWKPAPLGPVLASNQNLSADYTLADLAAARPLPDPYPFKDRGWGVYTPAAGDAIPQNWQPLADAARDRQRACADEIVKKTRRFREKGDAAAGRDAAVMLCRYAFDYPAIDVSNFLHAKLVQPGPYGRDLGCRRRDPRGGHLDMAIYDQLFDLIQADTGLAASVGRFVPWVKTPRDLIKLLDVYLVQTAAKRWLRYHFYYANEPTRILGPVLVLGDRTVTDPWMDWLFRCAFIYPLPPSGIQDLLVTGNDRDGIGYIASYSYALGEQCAPKAAQLERYIENGGNPKYDLRDRTRYPKPVDACHWFIDSRIAGLSFPRIGDVAGPDKAYGLWMDNLAPQLRLGWRWTRDPRFAAALVRHFARDGESDAEWTAIEEAAAGVGRSPFWSGRSRIVANWFGLIESGWEYDDSRGRRHAMLRVGQGWGHAHHDTLDLQVFAHGLPMTIDGGQRNGYSRPADSITAVHNLVEVDRRNWRGHSWVTALNDQEGARYLAAEATPPRNHPDVRLYRRQVALIDVAEPGPEPAAGAAGLLLDKDQPAPDSYVFDVVRVAGGATHTYCFHGPIDDELLVNLENPVVGAESMEPADRDYVSRLAFSEEARAGTAPAVVEATWRFCRGPNVDGTEERRAAGTEAKLNRAIWNPDSPRKYTRLHVLGQEGARVLTGHLHCRQWGYRFNNLFVQQRGETSRESVFPALIEPYAGEPFIAARALVAIPGNEDDARRAVAVTVATRNGRTEVCFADGRPEKTRTFQAHGAAFQIAAEQAFVSTDAEGLRLASLTGGTRLETPLVALRPAARERTGRVTRVDYPTRTLHLDAPWSSAALLKNRVVELGRPGRMTAYTIAAASSGGNDTTVTVTGGADFYLSRVLRVEEAEQRVVCALAMPGTTKEEPRPLPGLDRYWAASNEEGTRFWRADALDPDPATVGEFRFQLDGPVRDADFGAARGFRLWEYGTGDTMRIRTAAGLRRIQPGLFELTADGDVTVGLKAAGMEISTDRTTWQPLKGQTVDGRFEAAVTTAHLLAGKGRVYLRTP